MTRSINAFIRLREKVMSESGGQQTFKRQCSLIRRLSFTFSALFLPLFYAYKKGVGKTVTKKRLKKDNPLLFDPPAAFAPLLADQKWYENRNL